MIINIFSMNAFTLKAQICFLSLSFSLSLWWSDNANPFRLQSKAGDYSFLVLSQNSSDTPITPKASKDHRDIFFPASVSTPCLHTHAQTLPAQEHEAKLSKNPRPLHTHSHSHTAGTPTQMYCPPQGQQDQAPPRTTPSQPIAGVAFLHHTGKKIIMITHYKVFLHVWSTSFYPAPPLFIFNGFDNVLKAWIQLFVKFWRRASTSFTLPCLI